MKPEMYIDLMSLRSVNQEPMNYVDFGHHLFVSRGQGFVGGVLSNIYTDNQGRVYVQSLTASSLLSCGHAINDISLVSGACSMCQGLACVMPGCLAACSITNRIVCRSCYDVHNGVVVSNLAKEDNMFWRLKAKLMARQRKAINHATKRLPEKT
jgi:hypothetical protein